MLKYFTIIFALLTLVVAGCSSKTQEQLDMEHALQIEEQELQQEEEAEKLLAQEEEAEKLLAQESAAIEVTEEVETDQNENLLEPATIEVIQPEEPTKKPNIVDTISRELKSLLIPSGKSQQEKQEKVVDNDETLVKADNVSASGKLSSTKFVPESPLAIFSAIKLVPCKKVPEKMESIHKRLLKIKDVNIADSKLRDKTNDTLMPVVHFDFDQITVKPAYSKLLKQQSGCVMKALKSRGDMIIQIAGHADERGSDEYNMALGHRRANVVANAIKVYISDLSLAKIFSFGEEFPLVGQSSKSAWAKNRRVEFTLLLKP